MSRATFTIVYDGPALTRHTMDVRDLAPALLAVGELFDATNDALNGSATKVAVEVKAHEPGCFAVVLEILQSVVNQGIALLSGDGITAAINLQSLIFGGGGIIGLVTLIKRLKGKHPDKIERLSPDMIRLTYGTETFDVPLKLLRLYQDIAIRTSVERLVERPLQQSGITNFKVLDGTSEIVSVTKEESHYFKSPEFVEKTLIKDRRKAAFSIISLAFKDDNKWRLNDGSNQISALIEDQDFLSRVDRNIERFSKGDVLVCEVRFEQKQTAKGLVTEHIVEKVIEHVPAPRQLDLLIPDMPDDMENP